MHTHAGVSCGLKPAGIHLSGNAKLQLVGLRTWNGSSLCSGISPLDVRLCCCQWRVNLIIQSLSIKTLEDIFLSPQTPGRARGTKAAWPPCGEVLITVPCLGHHLPTLSSIQTHFAYHFPPGNISNKSWHAHMRGLHSAGYWEKNLLPRNIL